MVLSALTLVSGHFQVSNASDNSNLCQLSEMSVTRCKLSTTKIYVLWMKVIKQNYQLFVNNSSFINSYSL